MTFKSRQHNLFSKDKEYSLDFKDPYFNSYLITYLGNKRKLLPFLYKGFLKIQKEIGEERLIIFDGFAGSGVVSRLLKTFAKELFVNDMEDYCKTINSAYLTNKSEVNFQLLNQYIDWLNQNKLNIKSKGPGIIEKNYAPKNDNKIELGERVFYTNTNAKIIDNLRILIEKKIPESYKTFCLASLLVEASIHNNTSGVFKGFHKKNGIGHFGGKGENALLRIKQDIQLKTPIFSDYECPIHIYKMDTNQLVRDPKLPKFDLAYYDPPYNQHPYGSNYFMLNIINNGKLPDIQKGVSGIPVSWNRSQYNSRHNAEIAMNDLIFHTNSRYIAISYNNEGLIPIEKFKNILSHYGKYELLEQDYNTYRGSRNLHDRNIKVKEMLWILKKEK